MQISYSRSLNVIADVDVLVCGVGCAGTGAAVGAARLGASVLAVEQCGFAGGFMTAITSNATDGLCDMTTGEVVVGGVVLEILERLGKITLPLKSRKIFEPLTDQEKLDKHPGKLPIRTGNVDRFKLVADRLIRESGARVLYHTKVVDVVSRGGRIHHVVLGNKDGLTAVRPKVVVDCTGDADVAAWAGAPYEMAAVRQPGSLHFRVGNVDNANTSDKLYALTKRCAEVIEEAHRAGEMGVYAGPGIAPMGPGEVMFNAVRVAFDSTSAQQTSDAEIKGREDAWTMYSIWKERLPEFANAYFVTSGPVIGARESRRIVGERTLTADDVFHTRRYEDAVAKGSWYMDRHPSDTSGFHKHTIVPAYDISYGTLLPRKVENLLVAGRCHSADQEALASSRVNMTAMALGEGAGVGAAMAAAGAVAPADIDRSDLRRRLAAQGALL
ncbi:MAG: FAD-dependent oxidoreductase [SAR202 cluster bacterium]|nr:FAD-dependent oxidoreductase [SAR202 cluster bacterium]